MKRMLSHPVLGNITLELRTNSRNVTARWRGAIVHFIAPSHITDEKLFEVINRMIPKIMACKPKMGNMLTEGRRIEFADFSLTFTRQSTFPNTITGYPRLPDITIAIGTGCDLMASSTTTTARKVIDNVAKAIAPRLIIPRAMEIASDLGITTCTWRIGHGKKTLGTCSTRRLITLSSQMIFFSREMRDYIVCHELAHIKEMNHSPAFHDICDLYCQRTLHVPEAELEKRLKQESRQLKDILP